jgi:ketosteroid isomerase-like protein
MKGIFMKTKLLIVLLFIFVIQIGLADAQTKKTAKIDKKKIANTMKVGLDAFDKFTKGVQKGDWQSFFDVLADDFVIFFPRGEFQGESKGKERAMKFFKYVGETFKDGFTIVEKLRITANETTIVFELRDEAILNGKPYKNRVALSWDVRGNKISAYREYFGSDGKSN